MFKWVCLLVAVVALAAFGWMFNDVRLRIKELTNNADKQLAEVKLLANKADAVLTQSKTAVENLDRHLPPLLASTEKTAADINEKLPIILAHTESAVDELAALGNGFKQYRGLVNAVHAASQDKGMFAYASSILDLLDGQDATTTIGVKDTGKDNTLKKPMAAKEWAKMQRPEARLISNGSPSHAEVLHGLARTHASRPWYIQLANQTPRLLSDWLKETHPDSKNVK